ncbi:hypothetical protein ABH927_002343 [Planotetraspora sp. GP83]
MSPGLGSRPKRAPEPAAPEARQKAYESPGPPRTGAFELGGQAASSERVPVTR